MSWEICWDDIDSIVLAKKQQIPTALRLCSVSPQKTQQRLYSAAHDEESFESFSQRYLTQALQYADSRYEKFFSGVEDLFELQRGLNNCFAYDLVPSPGVIEQALRASRRVNDFATSVRIFEGIKQKVENKGQYAQYLDELKPLREELGITLKEDIGL